MYIHFLYSLSLFLSFYLLLSFSLFLSFSIVLSLFFVCFSPQVVWDVSCFDHLSTHWKKVLPGGILKSRFLLNLQYELTVALTFENFQQTTFISKPFLWANLVFHAPSKRQRCLYLRVFISACVCACVRGHCSLCWCLQLYACTCVFWVYGVCMDMCIYVCFTCTRVHGCMHAYMHGRMFRVYVFM